MDTQDPQNPYRSRDTSTSADEPASEDSQTAPPARRTASQYTLKDLCSYTALFGGIITTFYALVPLGWGHWVRVGVGLAVGFACSWLAEKAWTKWVEAPQREADGG